MTWLLPALLHQRALSAPRFAAMLRGRGYAISDSQVYRLLKRTPRRYDHALLVAACSVLECTVADLLQFEPGSSAGTLAPPAFRLPGA